MTYALYDIGGTKTRIAISRDGTTFEDPTIINTPKDYREGIDQIAKISKDLAGEPITAAGGGIAGVLSRDRSLYLGGPNLLGWGGRAIPQLLSEKLGCPVYLENDTAIVGLGEAYHGAGKGGDIVVYMTISTGVGGVRIVHGDIDVSVFGFEPGHQIIDAGGGLHKGVGGYGVDLEGYISGSAVEMRYGKKPFEITDPEFWDEMARLLAYGLNNTIVHWSPDIVVLGGSMMKQIGIPVNRVREHLAGMLHIYPQLPRIVKAELGDIGGIYGALHFIDHRYRETIRSKKLMKNDGEIKK
jgi:predicted NBD/HSP70 family sugar kinase